MNTWHISGLLAAVLCLLLGAGCAGYKLGPTNGATAGAKSIEVVPFKNLTAEARLAEPVTAALRKRLQQDGTFRLATHGDGDLVVRGDVTALERGIVSLQPSDVQTARDYSLTLVAHVIVTERASGKVLLDRSVAGRSIIRVGSDLTSGERQAMPILAEDLARQAASLIVDGNW